jgi:hypothetical protein
VAREQVVQPKSGQGAAGDGALIGAMIHDFPTFGVLPALTQRFAELFQPPAAPQILPQHGLKSQWR